MTTSRSRIRNRTLSLALALYASHALAANYTFVGDVSIPAGISSDVYTVSGLLTTDVSGGTIYAGSLAASAVSGGDINIVGAAQATTMTGGFIKAGALTSATVSSGTIHAAGDATIATFSNASLVAGGTVTVTTMTSGSIDAGTLYATTVTGGTIHTTGDAHITTLSGATMVVDGSAFFTTIASGTLTVNGPVTITTISSGSFTLNGNVVLTTFSAGSLTLNGLSTSITTLSGGTIDLGSTNLTLSSGTFAGTFTGGTGTITKDGAGTLTFAQPNAFSGTLLVTGGILAATVHGALSSVSAITVQGANLLAVDYNPAASLTLDASATAIISGSNLTLGAVINDNFAAVDPLDFTGIAGTITLLSLSGAGVTSFDSQATILGGVSSGTVKAAGLLTAGVSGGTVIAGSLASNSVTGGDITVAGDASIGLMTAGTAHLSGALITIGKLDGGTVALGATSTLTVSAGIMTGTITGSGASVIKNGPGLFVLSDQGTFDYSGGTTIKDGTLRLGADQQLPPTNPLTVTGGVFDLDGFSQTLGIVSLTGGGIRNGRLNGLHFALEEGYVSATLEGAGSVTKSTSGAVTLSGANAYEGGTTMESGTLTVTHAQALGNGPVVVNGGTLVVEAAITNAVTVGTGGTLTGTGSMGQLTLGPGATFSQGGALGGLTSSGLKISGGALFIWEIHAVGQGLAGYDSPVINGSLDLSGASPPNRITVRIVSLSQPGDIAPGTPLGFSVHEINRFVFMTYAAPLNLGANLNVADLFTYDVSQFSYSDGTGTDASLWSMSFNDTSGQLTLTAVPEPSTYGLGLAALGLAIAAVRRRRRARPDAP